jgi:hypothetical protein
VIDRLFELQSRYGFNECGIEKGQFRLAMDREIERRMIEYQQWFNINELSTTGSKLSRIKALVPIINSGRLTVIDTGDGSEMLMEQMALIDNGAILSEHDDLIDAASQLCQMNLYYNNGTEPTRDDYKGYTEPFKSSYH